MRIKTVIRHLFLFSQKTTDALEEAGKASGGAYEFQVEIGNDTGRISLLDADAGGYAENVASAEGLAENYGIE